MASNNPVTDPGGGVALGRIVHFVVGESDIQRLRECGGNESSTVEGDLRAATIVRVWNDTTVNLRVHTDAPRDYWATSVQFMDDGDALEKLAAGGQAEYRPRTWHWPPRV